MITQKDMDILIEEASKRYPGHTVLDVTCDFGFILLWINDIDESTHIIKMKEHNICNTKIRSEYGNM